ncbi:hypothetical protein OE88DRAFT_180236 [Heliocybe sulcata]|uniref:PD-(D/E)XK nuclease-like domain-containing protein n=1 Tax=Heliocybe sulcata TaxID=5364 RepID=A0A5C3N185_9AGAM|nr:hypothetical protein OE88DRAFT_180236 [Heliocybe sulcata]
MVDYVICLGSDAGPDGLEHPHPSSSPPPSLHSRIDELLSSSDDDDHGPAAGSVNHTVYPALRRMPIAISIETEVVERTEEEARVQLGIWVAAQAKRIHMLLGAAARQRIRGTGMGTEAEVEEDVRRILQRALFPLLFVQTDTWTVYLARVSLVDNALPSTGGPLRVHIYTSFVLGSTSSIVGIYTLLSGLGVLLDWVTTEYRRWWEAILDFAEGKEIGVVG